MVRLSKIPRAEIFRRLPVAMLALALGVQVRAQDLGPKLLQAAQQAYRQQLSVGPSLLAPRPEQAPGQERISAIRKRPPIPLLSDWSVLNQLQVGDRVVCQTKDGVAHRGEFRAVSDGAITLEVGKREVTFLREEVISVRLRHRGHYGKTALLGAAVGFGVGALIGGRGEDDPAVFAAIVGGLFGGAGALIGAELGWPQETTIYRVNPEHSAR